MRKTLLITTALFSFVFSKAQTLAALDTGKYRIELPGYWGPGNKIWRVLTEKLPQVCSELSGKELCGDDCNPRYRIELEMSDPVILGHIPNHVSSDFRNTPYYLQTETWNIRTLYQYESSLLLRDETGKIITRLIIVDTNEVWGISNKATLTAYAPPSPASTIQNMRRMMSRNTSAADFSAQYAQQTAMGLPSQTGQEGETPFAYINKNREKLVPTQRDMLAIIDSKINGW